MDIAISGHQVELSDAFQTHASDAVAALAEKYFQRAIGTTVVLGRGPHGNGFAAEIVMHVMQGVILKGSGAGQNANRAFDIACEKIDKQLRRHIRRLKDRHAGGLNGADAAPVAPLEANYRVFAALPDTGDEEDAEPAETHPVVVAERAVDIPTASVADAVMMLDLRNTTALLFKNAGSGAFNMVYRREDGAIGWVEPDGRSR